MVSKEDICNGALAFVDSPNRMRSFIDPDSSGDYACVEFYDLARRKLLSLHTWAFATVTERMSPVDMAKVPENQHPRDQRDRFLVHPEGTMMVSKVMDQSGDRVNYNLVSVQVEGKWTTVVRTSDRDPLWIERVFDQEETGQFDHNFVPLLQVLLASYISVPLDASQSPEGPPCLHLQDVPLGGPGQGLQGIPGAGAEGSMALGEAVLWLPLIKAHFSEGSCPGSSGPLLLREGGRPGLPRESTPSWTPRAP